MHFLKILFTIDIQYIIDNSDLGIFYKSKINKLKDNNKENLKIKKNEIKLKEEEINNQKNLLSKEEIEKKIVSLNKLVKNYQIEQNKKNKLVIDKKKIYTSKILKLLNPLLTNYVEKNKITLVVDKKIY